MKFIGKFTQKQGRHEPDSKSSILIYIHRYILYSLRMHYSLNTAFLKNMLIHGPLSSMLILHWQLVILNFLNCICGNPAQKQTIHTENILLR